MKRSSHTQGVEARRSAFRLPPCAFTLVELLVVVTIISMLAALLLPAVMSARGRARIAQCMNNQRQVGLAIQQYDMAKQHLPGFANSVNTNCIGWAPVLLPFLGRVDLWEGVPNTSNPALSVPGWRSGNPAPSVYVRLNDLLCPDDDAGATTLYPLSYVVNLGSYNAVPATTGVPPVTTVGLFRDYFSSYSPAGPTNTITGSSVKSPSRTIMLGELAFVNASGVSRQWTWGGPVILSSATSGSPLGFAWPDPSADSTLNSSSPPLQLTYLGVPTLVSGATLLPPLAATMHKGIVNVTFCDGHCESLPDNTLCKNDPTNMVFGMP
jgi:prepilin-type N-terminal cleavage/methylation domain-containing protein/prepilin-type processing-associated H-X9-DG protein